MVGELEENMVVVQKAKWLENKNQDGLITRDNMVGDYLAGEKDTRCLENKRQYSWRTRDKMVGEQETRR